MKGMTFFITIATNNQLVMFIYRKCEILNFMLPTFQAYTYVGEWQQVKDLLMRQRVILTMFSYHQEHVKTGFLRY